jgi:hypothetical protein
MKRTCTGLWTERRTCPRSVQSALSSVRHVECVRLAHADDVPLLVLPEDTCCRRCGACVGNEPQCETTGPTKTHVPPSTREGCRRPVDQGAFHRCERGHVKGFLLPCVPRRPLVHAAHTFSPWLGTMCSSGIANIARGTSPRTTRRSLRCDFERAGRLYNLVVDSCESAPGPDDPSTPTWLGEGGR